LPPHQVASPLGGRERRQHPFSSSQALKQTNAAFLVVLSGMGLGPHGLLPCCTQRHGGDGAKPLALAYLIPNLGNCGSGIHPGRLFSRAPRVGSTCIDARCVAQCQYVPF
jgi:hypothetical protein